MLCGQSVYEARRRAGRLLAQTWPVEADVVIGIPDSGLDAAMGYAEESRIPLWSGSGQKPLYRLHFHYPGSAQPVHQLCAVALQAA